MKMKRIFAMILTAVCFISTLGILTGCAPASSPATEAVTDPLTEPAAPSVDNGSGNPDAVIPVLCEDYRELYHPSAKVGIYVNDHTVFPTHNVKNSWNVIGITNTRLEGGNGEKYFANGVGESLAVGKFTDNPATNGIVLNSKNMQPDPTPNPVRPGELCWAPHVIYENDQYYMFYFSTMLGRWHVGCAVSSDLVNWNDITEEITLTVPDPNRKDLIYADGNIAQTRDVMIIKHEGIWLMYATSQYLDGSVKRGAVAVYKSTDLKNWTFVDFVLKNLDGAPIAGYSTCESPFVIKKDGKFILALTETDSGIASYHDTILFVSDDPYNFGTYSGASKLDESPCYVGRIPAHCAEFIHDAETGKWYVTTGGWRNLVKFEGSTGGVGIAEIKWLTPEEYKQHTETICDSHTSAVLNHSFEDRTLTNWVTVGDFGRHMINDAFLSRYGGFRDMIGKYTFCSYSNNANGGDLQKGKMASNVFTLSENAKMSFSIAGGDDINNLYVAIVDAETNEIIRSATGKNTENARRITWDLSAYAGKDAYVLVVDNSTGAWGHIGVDCIIVDGVAKNEWPDIK